MYYDFGLADLIRKLFADPEWAAARGKGMDTSAAGFHGSGEAVRLNRVTRGLFAQDSSRAYELGMDFGQIFNFKTHSAGIVLLRRVLSYDGILHRDADKIVQCEQRTQLH